MKFSEKFWGKGSASRGRNEQRLHRVVPTAARHLQHVGAGLRRLLLVHAARPRLPALPRRRDGRGDLRPPAHSSRPRIHRVAVGLPAGRIADGQVVLALAQHFESRVLQSGDDIGVSMLSRAPDRGKSSSAAGGESVHSGTGVDLYVRWSNVAADPDVTSGERTYRQGSDRPCSGLRWPRPANPASGQSVHLPSGLYDAHPLWRTPRIRTVIDIEVVSQHANAADATTAQRGVRCT